MSYGKAMGDAIAGAIIGLVLIAFAVGAFAMWAIPKAWAWLKPLIHAWTT